LVDKNFKNTAYLFPGQGAQYPGMAVDLLLSSDNVRQLFDTASEIFNQNIKDVLESDADNLKRTDVSQPAITVANLAAAAFLDDMGFSPAAAAGFSLGEYAALVCAGIIDTAVCFRLIKKRGAAMQKAADRLSAGSAAPGMAAVIGLSPDNAEQLILRWQAEGLKDIYAANINSPKQLVVSGTAAALAEAETRFKEAGAKRVIRLQVAGPFHSPLVSEAADEFAHDLKAAEFRDPVIPIFSNVTGKKISTGEEAKELALKQITSPVRWTDIEQSIALLPGIGACLEAGPGKVLQGLWKDTGSGIPVFAAGTKEDILKLGENS